MASWISSLLSFLGLSKLSDDISVSHKIVRSLPLQPSTKYFTLALRHPQQPKSVLYMLSTMLLSEQSASDADDLINAVKPGAVITNGGVEAIKVVGTEDLHSWSLQNLDTFPKSALHVLKESFNDGNIYAKYLKMAQTEVVRAIFGTSFMGHVVAAKQAARESKSLFYYLENLEGQTENADAEDSANSNEDSIGTARHIATSLGSFWFSHLDRDGKANLSFPGLQSTVSYVQDALAAAHSQAERSALGQVDTSAHSEREFDCPEFARLFYPFLADLYNTYKHLPGVGLALERTQKVLRDVEEGNVVDPSELSICQTFRLAAEGLRVVLHASAQASLQREKVKAPMPPFEELPYEEKCYVLLAQALKQQLERHDTVVAVVDASMVAGIRRYWATPVPDYVAALAMDCLISDTDEAGSLEADGSKGTILDKPIIVVGAGAAAAVGLASFSQWAPASTAMKILTFKIPMFVKVAVVQTKQGAVAAVAKAANPVISWFVPSGKGFLAAKSTMGSKASVMKAVASTGNVRAAAHSVLTTAKRFSLSALRTAFYNAMRNRHRKGVGGKLWLSFGASVGLCAGLLQFGEGIENVIEIIPETYSISHLCQGVNNVCQASEELKQVEDANYWQAMYSRLYKEFKH